MTRCPSGKVRYRDDIGAKLALAQLRRLDGPKHLERRAYRCPKCKGWHLTSKAKPGDVDELDEYVVEASVASPEFADALRGAGLSPKEAAE